MVPVLYSLIGWSDNSHPEMPECISVVLGIEPRALPLSRTPSLPPSHSPIRFLKGGCKFYG
jgi:hypothetical protein